MTLIFVACGLSREYHYWINSISNSNLTDSVCLSIFSLGTAFELICLIRLNQLRILCVETRLSYLRLLVNGLMPNGLASASVPFYFQN